jgi:hypothetical protein
LGILADPAERFACFLLALWLLDGVRFRRLEERPVEVVADPYDPQPDGDEHPRQRWTVEDSQEQQVGQAADESGEVQEEVELAERLLDDDAALLFLELLHREEPVEVGGLVPALLLYLFQELELGLRERPFLARRRFAGIRLRNRVARFFFGFFVVHRYLA